MNSDHVDTDPAEDPPFQISFEMVTTAIAEKAGPITIAEILKTSGITDPRVVKEFATTMIRNLVTPSDLKDSFIINIRGVFRTHSNIFDGAFLRK